MAGSSYPKWSDVSGDPRFGSKDAEQKREIADRWLRGGLSHKGVVGDQFYEAYEHGMRRIGFEPKWTGGEKFRARITQGFGEMLQRAERPLATSGQFNIPSLMFPPLREVAKKQAAEIAAKGREIASSEVTRPQYETKAGQILGDFIREGPQAVFYIPIDVATAGLGSSVPILRGLYTASKATGLLARGAETVGKLAGRGALSGTAVGLAAPHPEFSVAEEAAYAAGGEVVLGSVAKGLKKVFKGKRKLPGPEVVEATEVLDAMKEDTRTSLELPPESDIFSVVRDPEAYRVDQIMADKKLRDVPIEATYEDGKLIVTDGSHRLAAKAVLGEPVKVNVVRGIDSAKRRTVKLAEVPATQIAGPYSTEAAARKAFELQELSLTSNKIGKLGDQYYIFRDEALEAPIKQEPIDLETATPEQLEEAGRKAAQQHQSMEELREIAAEPTKEAIKRVEGRSRKHRLKARMDKPEEFFSPDEFSKVKAEKGDPFAYTVERWGIAMNDGLSKGGRILMALSDYSDRGTYREEIKRALGREGQDQLRKDVGVLSQDRLFWETEGLRGMEKLDLEDLKALKQQVEAAQSRINAEFLKLRDVFPTWVFDPLPEQAFDLGAFINTAWDENFPKGLGDKIRADNINPLRQYWGHMQWTAKRFPQLWHLVKSAMDYPWKSIEFRKRQLIGHPELTLNVKVGGEQRLVPPGNPSIVAALRGKDLQAFGDIVNLVEKQKAKLGPDQLEWYRQNHPEAAAAYVAAADSMNWHLWRFYKRFSNKSDDEIAKIADPLYGKFFSHVRRGKYYMTAYKLGEGGEKPKTAFLVRYDNRKEHRALSQYMKDTFRKEDGYVWSGAQEPLKTGGKQDRYLGASPELVTDLMAKIKEKGEMTQELYNVLQEEIDNIFARDGFKVHQLHRQDIPGYRTDPQGRVESFFSYLDAYAGYENKVTLAKEMADHMSKLDTYDKRLMDEAKEWSAFVMRNYSQMEQNLAKLRGLVFWNYIGLNAKTASLQLTQNFTDAVPVLQLHMGGVTKAERSLLRAQKDIFKDQMRLKGLTADEHEALIWAHKVGVAEAIFTKELSGHIDDVNGGVYENINKVMGMLFGYTERHVRESTFLAGYRFYRDKGYTAVNARNLAAGIVQSSHYYYGKANIPKFAREGGGVFLRIPWIFKSYMSNHIQQLGWFLTGKHGKQAAIAGAKSFLYLGALGGVPSALILGGVPMEIYKRLTGKDPEYEVEKWLSKKTDNQGLVDLIMYGIPSLTQNIPGMPALSLRSSMEIGSESPRSMTDLLGPAYDMFWEKPWAAKRRATQDDWWGFMEESIPLQAAVKAMKGWRGYKVGKTTPSGELIRDGIFPHERFKYTGAEAISKGLGFPSVREERAYRHYSARNLDTRYWQQKRSDVYSQLRLAGSLYLSGNKKAGQEKFQGALEAVKDYNLQWPGLPDYHIKSEDIKRAFLDSARAPSSREMEQYLRMTGQLDVLESLAGQGRKKSSGEK